MSSEVLLQPVGFPEVILVEGVGTYDKRSVEKDGRLGRILVLDARVGVYRRPVHAVLPYCLYGVT